MARGWIRGGAVAAAVLLAAAGIGGPDAAWGQQKAPIKIGAMFQLTGKLAEYGKHGSQGARMAEKEINERGGILGRPVEILLAHEGNPAIGVREARKFILQDKVDFLMGIDSSGIALAVNDIAKEFRKIIIYTHAATGKLTGEACHPYAFRNVNNAAMDARAAAIIIAKKPAKRWANIGPDYEFGRVSWDDFKVALKKLKPDVEFVGEAWPKLGEPDFTSHINAILQAKPDGVWSTLWGGDLVAFVKQAKPFGFFDKVKFFVDPVGASLSVLAPLGDEMPEGLWVSSRWWFLYPETPQGRVFVNAYKALYDQYPDYVAMSTYSAIYLLKRVIEQVGSLDTEKLVKALEGITYEDPEGKKTIRKEDHQVMKNLIWGRTKKSDKYPFRILGDITVIPGEKVIGTVEESGCKLYVN